MIKITNNTLNYKSDYKLFFDKYEELIQNKETINQQQINIAKHLYPKYINTHSNSIKLKCKDMYEDILFLEIIIKEYGNVKNFLDKINGIIRITQNFKKFKIVPKDEENILLIMESKNLLQLVNDNKVCLNRIFIVRNLKNLPLVIKNYNDLILKNHDIFIYKRKIKNILNNILTNLYSSQIDLYKFIDSHDYIDINLRDSILKTKQINCKLEQLRKTENALITDKVKIDINKYIDIFKNKIDNHNIKFVLSEKNKYANFFRNIEQKALDNQQIEAILKDEYNNLVIAGAGCGKTITILG